MLMLSSMKAAVSLLMLSSNGELSLLTAKGYVVVAVVEWRVVAADGEGYIVAATVSKGCCVAADAIVVGYVVVAADEGCVVAAATVGEGWSTLISPDA
ncbi:hypothetical protein PF001_g24093 [Phytophthora fragariae]|uniref:Secreted protein n=1 Tax=Phytophthora fragariae TaxID=53985 RepID=A0A6A4C027_9STRA|nr:hypothetical protein PF001_g24093 [Phytophthora fragariae]